MRIRAVPAKVSVVVPTFANAQAIELLVQEISQVLLLEGREFEIILVNDGSPDATWDIIQRMHLAHPSVRGINLMRNYGQHSALLAGIFNARFEIIVTLDDDFQTPPAEIPKAPPQNWMKDSTWFMGEERRNSTASRGTSRLPAQSG